MAKTKSKYDKKVTISLTESDFAQLEALAEADRRTTNQYASMMVEDVLDLERKDAPVAEAKAKVA